MAVLADGSLLVAGGSTGVAPLAGDVWRVVPAGPKGAWKAGVAAPLPVASPLTLASMVVVDDGAYLGWGRGADGLALRQVLRFDATGGQWTSDLLATLPEPRAGGALAVVAGSRSAYLLGGWTDDLAGPRPARDLWRLSLDGDGFKPVVIDVEPPVFVRGAVAVDGKTGDVLMHGGLSGPPDAGGVAVGQFLRFRPDPVGIESLQDGPSPRSDHTLVWTGDGFLLHGGREGDKILGDVWSWSAADGWASITAPPMPRAGHSAFWDEAGARMLVVGGAPSGDLAAFDPVARKWTTLIQHDLLDMADSMAFLDPDARTLLLVSPAFAGAGVLLVPGPGAPSIAAVAVSHPPVRDGMHVFDPFGRRAVFFGGVVDGEGVTSAIWVLPERCP